MKKIIAAAFILLLPLSGCGGNTSSLKSAQITQAPVATPSITPNHAATPLPTIAPVETSIPIIEKLPQTYIMNKNYDLVPIDPAGDRKVVLLTFDDGPKDKKMIDTLIDVLDKHEAKAIFFMNGYRIKSHPELVKLVFERGQIIGNHAWDHIDLKKESNAIIDQQIRDVQKIIEDTIGITPAFFRPPYGSSNDYVRDVAKQEKMLFMTWSNGSLDWDLKKSLDITVKSALLIENVLNQLHKGSNILMHELPWTVAALDSLLTQLEEKGYSFLDPRAIVTQLE